MPSHTPASEDPKKSWLARLAEESWEAELIISGVAIYGSLAIHGQIHYLVDWTIQNLPGPYLASTYLLFFYLFVGAQVLIMSFITHFFLRVLWVGMVGLYSVYPHGIKRTPKYSESFNDKLLADFSDLGSFNQKLDQYCSLVFAIGSGAFMSLTSIAISMVVVLLVVAGIHQIFPQIQVNTLFSIAFTTIFVVFAFASILHLKALREKPFVERIHYPLYKLMTRSVYGIFFRPANYIYLTFFTNSQQKKYFGFLALLMVIILAGTVFSVLNSNVIFLLKSDLMDNLASREDRVYMSMYEDQGDPETMILHAAIPSDIIETDYLRVFVPVMKRDANTIDASCPKVPSDSTRSDKETRRLKRENSLNCLADYHVFQINGDTVQAVIKRYSHPYTQQDGLLAYISNEQFQRGENSLVIQKKRQDEEGDFIRIQIPFIYAGDLPPATQPPTDSVGEAIGEGGLSR
ncbi:MAG: hypothetical protein AAFQ92_08245 [Bacteroidota bacterium]